MSKNAWSLGCRFVAVAALAIGASSAVAGTAAAGEGGGAERACPKAASTGCHKQGRHPGSGYGRWNGRQGSQGSQGTQGAQGAQRTQGMLGRLLIIEDLNRGGGRLLLADPIGLAASRSMTGSRAMPLRIDPALKTTEAWSSSSTLSSLPNPGGTIVTGRVTNNDPRAAKTTEITTSLRTLPETIERVTRVTEFGSLLRTGDRGGLLEPAASVLGTSVTRPGTPTAPRTR